MLCDVERTGANFNCNIGKMKKKKQMKKCVVCSPAAADCEAERERGCRGGRPAGYKHTHSLHEGNGRLTWVQEKTDTEEEEEKKRKNTWGNRIRKRLQRSDNRNTQKWNREEKTQTEEAKEGCRLRRGCGEKPLVGTGVFNLPWTEPPLGRGK